MDNRVTFELLQAARAYRVRSAKLLARVGLYPGQDALLKLLDRHGRMTMGEAAAALSIQPPTVTKMVNRLSAAGLVQSEGIIIDKELGREKRLKLAANVGARIRLNKEEDRIFTDMGLRFVRPEEVGLPKNLIYLNKWDFGPRGGFAWRLSDTPRPIVVRGGYAIFGYPMPLRDFNARMRQNPPTTARFTYSLSDSAQTPDRLPNYGLRSAPQVIAGVNSKDVLDLNRPGGISRGSFNSPFAIPWLHPHGDWRDALGVAVATFLTSLPLFLRFDPDTPDYQFEQLVPWIPPPGLGVSYHVGVDGISVLLVLLTTFLTPVALASAWRAIEERTKEFLIAMLVLETGMLGVFVSLDLFLFFVFWEAMLVPMYFIIGVWGGERRVHAAIKFFIFTALGSALMFAGILALGLLGGEAGPTFDFVELLGADLSRTAQFWLFAAFGLSFAVKVPVFPLHTWLPDAHVEAPTAGSVILAGVLLKLGAYGLLRFNLTLFPEAAVALVPLLAVLAVVGILYGAVVALVQTDVKRLVAYSSVSHLGFVVLGIFALTGPGLQGGVLQMVNHGLTTGGLFLLVGMIYDRRHTREISQFGGLATVMPLYAGAFLFIALASIGLPGLNGFVGEFLVLVGAYLALPPYAVLAALGVVLAAVYLLWAYQRMFNGPISVAENRGLADLGIREGLVLAPLVVLVLFLGIYPKPALDRIEPSVDRVLVRIEQATEYRLPQFAKASDLRAASGPAVYSGEGSGHDRSGVVAPSAAPSAPRLPHLGVGEASGAEVGS